MTEADHDPILGLTLEGRYQVRALLGKGGMGRVYLAEERLLRRRCAIKLLPREHCENATNVERFLREAQVIAQVRHENVVEIYSFGQDPNGEVFYAMELLSGQDLEARLRDPTQGLPNWRELCAWGVQICRALAAVHDAGFVHRDIKPGNLFLTHRGDGSALLKLLDFGIARPTESELTSTGAFLGTVPYMSPEQVQALPLDGRSDIYALGILFYRAIAGRPPFRGDPIHVVQQHVHASPPPLPPLAPDLPLPVALLDIIDRCLRKSRDERFQKMREVEAALSALLAEQDPPLAGPAARALLPPTASPHESTDASTQVHAARRVDALALVADPSQSALLTTRFPAAHEQAAPPLAPADPPALAPEDSLDVPRHRFGAVSPGDLPFDAPPADSQLTAQPSAQTEMTLEPGPPTHAPDLLQQSGSRSRRRRLLVLTLVAVTLLALLPILRKGPSEREPAPPTVRAAPRPQERGPASPPVGATAHRPPELPTSPDPGTVASSIPALSGGHADPQWSVPALVDSPLGDTPEIAPEAPQTPEIPPQVASPPQVTSPPLSAPRPPSPRRASPRTLEEKARRCRREHAGTSLPPIDVVYTLSNGKVLRARTITTVSPALASCLEDVLRNTSFPLDEFGVDKHIFF